MNENREYEIEQLMDAISKIDFIRGRRNSNQYAFPIQRILRQAGYKTRLEYPVSYPEGHVYRNGYVDVWAKKGKKVICVEIDYKTPKFNSILKISRILKAIPVFVLTYEGEPDIEKSFEKINLPKFYLIDIYNHRIYTEKDK